jgi:hypothetical protein
VVVSGVKNWGGIRRQRSLVVVLALAGTFTAGLVVTSLLSRGFNSLGGVWSQSVFGNVFRSEGEVTLKKNLGDNLKFFVDPQFNILVIDMDAGSIFKFDQHGNYVKAIGGKGRKPGDLVLPISLDIDDKGRIYVVDAHSPRLTIFGKNGGLVNSFLLKRGEGGMFGGLFTGLAVRVDSKRQLIYIGDSAEAEQRNLIHQFSADGHYIKSFYPMDESVVTELSAKRQSGYMLSLFDLDNSGNLYAVQPYVVYEISKYSPHGRLETRFSTEKILFYKELPPLVPGKRITASRIIGIFASANAIFCCVYNSGNYWIDIYRLDGKPIYKRIDVDRPVEAIDWSGSIYFVGRRTEQGYPVLTKFKFVGRGR